MDSLIKLAASQLGEKEVEGSDDHNDTIIKYAHEAGFDWVNDDETPWCSIFLNWLTKKCGLKGSNQANARSWLLTGRQVTNPEPGDVVVFWRDKPDSWKGHVGIFMGFSKDGTRVYCLGGNQGNQVSISAYHADTVLGYRRLSPVVTISLPAPPLRNGDKGSKVKELQNALKVAGFDCGTSDGDFGPKTEGAIKKLQSVSGFLKIDGVYGPNTKEYLEAVLLALH